jgi:hypothetical protein
MTSDTVLMAVVFAIWTFNLAVLMLIILNLSLAIYRQRKRGY